MKKKLPEFKVVMRDINELIPAGYNPREMSDKKRQDLINSITDNGITENAIINMKPERKNIIVSAHQRISVAKELGYTHYPCYEVNVDLEQEKKLNLQMNKISGDFVIPMLHEMLTYNQLIGVGFEPDDLVFNDDKTTVLNNEFEISEMEAHLYEHQDYIVIVFDEMHDYLSACGSLGIKKVNFSKTKLKREIGIGRVISGKRFLKLFNDEN